MNKRILLTLACVAVLAFGVQCFAQNPADQAGQAASQAGQQAGQAASQAGQQTTQAVADADTRAKVQAKLQEISSELNLTDDQKTQLKPILQDEMGQIKAVKDDASLSPDQKKAKVSDIRQNYKSQINSVLTPDQQKKWAAMRETTPKD